MITWSLHSTQSKQRPETIAWAIMQDMGVATRAIWSTTFSTLNLVPKTVNTGTSTNSNGPVLIVGAGPTGLFMAILQRWASRADSLNVAMRTRSCPRLWSSMLVPLKSCAPSMSATESTQVGQEHGNHDLNSSSLLDKFMQNGRAIADFHVYFGKKPYSVLPMLRNTESHFGYGLFIDQSKTIAIPTEEFGRLSGQIDRGWELMDAEIIEVEDAKEGTNIRSTESNVLGPVELEADQNGKEYDLEVVRSEYLVAADGGMSTVRHKLIIHGDSGRSIIVMPMGNNRIHISFDKGHLTPEEHQAQKSEELTLAKFQEMVDEIIAPVKMELYDCQWLTYYRMNERLASRYCHKGRIFLSGDAAHVHSQEHKISLVLKGHASRPILETYETERPNVVADVTELLSGLFGTTVAEGIFRRSLRLLAFLALPYILSRVPRGPPIYHENAINQRHDFQAVPAEECQVGVRARDGTLRVIPHNMESLSIQSLRLHNLLVSPGVFHIIVFTSDMLTEAKGTALTTCFSISKNIEDYLASWRTKWPASSSSMGKKQESLFLVHSISGAPADVDATSDLNNKEFGEGKLYLDEEGTLHQRYGLATRRGQGSIVVLRPDSYIGYRVQRISGSAWENVNLYLKSILIGSVEPRL
ncbi:hypothetical protein BGX27_002422 [Mortierella sp. AM989]|nr:hypothetical protein BGX27_002422 [Mortierella sp. AM989]